MWLPKVKLCKLSDFHLSNSVLTAGNAKKRNCKNGETGCDHLPNPSIWDFVAIGRWLLR